MRRLLQICDGAAAHLLILFLTLAFCNRVHAQSDARDDCIVVDRSGTMVYDLHALKTYPHSGSYEVNDFETGYKFNLGICNALPEHNSNELLNAARWQRGDQSGSLGKANSSKLRLRENSRLIYEYKGGDVCPRHPQLNQSALILFICDVFMDADNYGGPELVSEGSHCAFVFEWRTPLACSQRRPFADQAHDNEESSSEPSQRSVIFVIVFVVGSVYILGGVLYNRVLNASSGLRGLEQLPNYKFWRGIFAFAKNSAYAVTDGVMHLVNAIRGRQRSVIRVDSAEHSFRNELFDSDDEEDALPMFRPR
ncbi:Cation-independent mannose-6-phosphate receptor CI-MPR [Kickxella alabastrina]|uniref:Cation-independent mannose-6-phosphate receptor CI-MPR n=1 Tax=Kickxella alabastrina TaxID=61397 RepID=A0ACC1IJ22_9FUNG|nr:Cation-independent mannose-6-phosphate receptor CI-MPR [Kickxella alabastrina]